MTGYGFKKLALIAGVGAATGMAAFGFALGDGAAAMGSPGLPAANVGLLAKGGVTTSTTAMSATPQIHAAEGGKCVKSSPNC